MRRWLGCRKRLRPKNLGTTLRMKTSRGGDFFATIFSSSPSHLRRRKERSVSDFSSPRRGGEASATSHPLGEKKTRLLLPKRGEEMKCVALFLFL
ncbi:hypothetical protein BHE74_00010725 [Ensete ventricosum]|nr:hypothetical protein BHE74_00010725 [Ensete ventricosum]